MSIDWQRYFLSWDGRLGRQDFWLGVLILAVVGAVVSRLPFIHWLAILLLWPQFCIGAKRLHDIGRSAVLLVVPFGVFLVCTVIATVVGGLAGLITGAVFGFGAGVGAGAVTGGLIMTVSWVVSLAFLLWVGLTPGVPHDNQYGPDEPSVFGRAPPVV